MLSTRIREQPSWTLVTHISKRDCSFCVVDRRAVTCHRQYRLTCALSRTRPRVPHLLLGMVRDPCNKLGPAPGVPPVLARPMVGEASGLTSSTRSHPTRMISESLFADLRPHFRDNQALARKCDRTAAGRQAVKRRVPLEGARLPVRHSTALTLPRDLRSNLRRLVKSRLLGLTTLTIRLCPHHSSCRRPMVHPTVAPLI